MKNITILLCITTLSTLIIGCGQDSEDVAPDFVNGTWEIRSINNIPFQDTFNSSQKAPEFEHEFAVTTNIVVFYDIGEFTIDLGFKATEKYPGDTPRSMTQLISSTAAGRFTTEAQTLKIISQTVINNVDVNLEPEATWRQQIEGITLEQFESDLATETKEGLDQESLVFKNNTEYTWQVKADLLTLSSQDQKVILNRVLDKRNK